MSWPLSHNFNEAVQNPRLVFADGDLKAAETIVGAQGLPLPRSGNFADVYQLRGIDGRDWAVKCFTRPVVGLGQRYAKVGEALEEANFPFTVAFSFLGEGIRVGDKWFPVVKMDWVEGLLLNQVVRDNAGRPGVLTALLQMWTKLCKRLREAGIAHADLQHGNVLLVPGSRAGAYGLKLIDYDGMYVPALANQPSGEVGHPAYQHPDRASRRVYSIDVDRFPHLVIAAALKGLSVVGNELWNRYDTGDNLLFTEEDFRKPGDSKLMKELWRTENAAVQSFVGRLALACGKPIPQTPWLDQFAPDGDPSPLSNAERREAAATLGVALPVPLALPPEPSTVAARPLPAIPAQVIALPAEPVNRLPGAELDFDIERKPTGRTKTHPVLKTSSRKPLWITVGVLLLVGAVVAGIVLSRGKPESTDSAEGDGNNGATGNRPKENGKAPGEVAPMPREKEAEQIAVKPKEKKFDPIVRVPIGKLQVRERWTTELGDDSVASKLVCGLDSKTVVAVGGNKLPTTAIDLATGKQIPGSATRSVLPFRPPIPLADGRFAIVHNRLDTPIAIWEPTAGRMAGNLKPISLPEGTPGRTYVSPNGEYVAFAGDGRDESLPFKLKHATTDKLILDLEVVRGKVFFTADSSRVLVTESTGQGRWFKLPSGEADGEWDLTRLSTPPRGPGFAAISGDGHFLLFDGHLGDKTDPYHLVDARNGMWLRSFRGQYMSTRASLSADGRLFASPRYNSVTKYSQADVVDTVTGDLVATLTAPAGYGNIFPVFTPDGNGIVALVRKTPEGEQSAIRYDLVPESTAPKTPIKPGDARWAVQIPDSRQLGHIHADSESDLVLLSAPQGGLAAVEYKSGGSRTGFAELAKTGVASFFTLDNNRLATISASMEEVVIWDAKSGKETGTIAVPEIPPGTGNAKLATVFVSPNGKYLAVGRGGVAVTTNPDVPFRLFEIATNKTLLSTDWKGGAAFFTADSSRVLVAEWTGRFRWFKLPSGEADGDWDFGPPMFNRRHTVFGISADGSSIAYNGPGAEKVNNSWPGVMDGKSGKMIRHFKEHQYASEVFISSDGQRAALMKGFSTDTCTLDVVEVATGKSLRQLAVISGRLLPPFALAPDGNGLIVFNPNEEKLLCYDVPAKSKLP